MEAELLKILKSRMSLKNKTASIISLIAEDRRNFVYKWMDMEKRTSNWVLKPKKEPRQ